MSTSAERVARHRARKKQEAEQERIAVEQLEELDGEAREQAIRDHFGYTSSETRTQAERAEAAARMIARL